MNGFSNGKVRSNLMASFGVKGYYEALLPESTEIQ
jgi:hypothetical protein